MKRSAETSKPGPLARVREALGFTIEEVAAHLGWAPAHLRRLERGGEIEHDEAVELENVYGVNVGKVLDGVSSEMPPSPIRALLRAQSDALAADTRFAIASSAGVAVDTLALYGLLGEPTVWPAQARRFKHNPDYSHPRDGGPQRMAGALRRITELGSGPVMSVLEFARGLGVQVLVADLERQIDSVSFASTRTGAVIVVNRRGIHTANAFGRRVTLAHELCHVLFDRPEMRAFSDFCQIARVTERHRRREKFEAIERRARAFAVHFLAPIEQFSADWQSLDSLAARQRIRVLMERYGIGYEAVRAHLHNADLLPMDTRVSLVDTETPAVWDERDPLPYDPSAALAPVPLVRRGEFLDLVRRAWLHGAVSESGARDLLRVPLTDWGPVRAAVRVGMTSPASGWRTSSSVAELPQFGTDASNRG